MVKHIVMWRVVSQTKEDVLKNIKERLENLNGQIDGLIHLEVGINYNASKQAYDAVLYSEFESKEALISYRDHEKHQEVANTYVRPFTVERAVVDFES
ncbi:Dabb family protein [Niameybacter massiliensis]|uniref:Dabb family protein n=1 Tax=Holtiella tumoricola TaxID=3018743 RepID=A0AA42J0Z6_9FIRM|nr:Dabb family protein [Holtiella tumoricola]MDA3731778.1 Dabb family protein [Holtiella tumoricola]